MDDNNTPHNKQTHSLNKKDNDLKEVKKDCTKGGAVRGEGKIKGKAGLNTRFTKKRDHQIQKLRERYQEKKKNTTKDNKGLYSVT